MIDIVSTIYKMYPQTVRTVGNTAYDVDGNEVTYDLQAVTAQAEADIQNIINIKNSAISKLSALGLTADEVKAILGTA